MKEGRVRVMELLEKYHHRVETPVLLRSYAPTSVLVHMFATMVPTHHEDCVASIDTRCVHCCLPVEASNGKMCVLRKKTNPTLFSSSVQTIRL